MHRQQLYKATTFDSKDDRNIVRRQEIVKNRTNKRNIIQDNHRILNIDSSSTQFDETNNYRNDDIDKDNIDLQSATSNKMTTTVTTLSPKKLTKQQLHLLKYKSWKKEKNQQKQKDQLNKKKPFLTVVPKGRFLEGKSSATVTNYGPSKNKPTPFKMVPPKNFVTTIRNKAISRKHVIGSPPVTRSQKIKLLLSPYDLPPLRQMRKKPILDNVAKTIFNNDNKEAGYITTTPLKSIVNNCNSETLNNSMDYLSPFVQTTRGKFSSKKERNNRISSYTKQLEKSLISVNDNNSSNNNNNNNNNNNETSSTAPLTGSVLSPLTIENRKAAEYFRNQLLDETTRLLNLVNVWETFKSDNLTTLQTEFIDLIDVASGLTKLLTSSKFVQFRELIDKCEQDTFDRYNQKSKFKVFPSDLEGFWSMIYKQIEQCDERFNNLNKLKLNNWQNLNDVDTVFESKINKTTAAGVGIQNIKRTKKERTHSNKDSTTELMLFMNKARKRIQSEKQLLKQDNGNFIINSLTTTTTTTSTAATTTTTTTTTSTSTDQKIDNTIKSTKNNFDSPKRSNRSNINEKLSRSILKTPGTCKSAKRVAFINDENKSYELLRQQQQSPLSSMMITKTPDAMENTYYKYDVDNDVRERKELSSITNSTNRRRSKRIELFSQ